MPHGLRWFGLLFRRDHSTLLLLAPEWAAGAAYATAFNVVYAMSSEVVIWDLYDRFVAGIGSPKDEGMAVEPEEPTSSDDGGHGIVDFYYLQDSEGDSASTASGSEDEEGGNGFDSDTTSMNDDDAALDETTTRLVPPQLTVVCPHLILPLPPTLSTVTFDACSARS
ncbi:hypothetical protein AMAG_20149 [Allomyces macrogynus ATCC 38327]|uniref:Uncharacterized protein n=1 Tax=Allomyces macrogynus (strain ATCC 38327) TaxID=578462 RepID=A0A0L0T5K8_ALLM3|nr:hypothetical protein AMAG_20149 [Allomyces macrogynus ATCC 38327]|eukprot:KNE69961.1 hypothetical protein AMAG_20149 [Allomyces macrogynus ATCC 38327]